MFNEEGISPATIGHRNYEHTYRWAIVFSTLSFLCLIVGAIYVYFEIIVPGPPDKNIIEALVDRYVPLIIISIFAFIFAHASIYIIKAPSYNDRGVVPNRDLDLVKTAITDGKSDPIDQYIRLASLNGGVGLFQKIGLTGLPLATLALVVLFTFGIMIFGEDGKRGEAFLDFTKLTLGAFIGSFVQRQVERRGQEMEIKKALDTAIAKGVSGQAQGQQSDAAVAAAAAAAAKGVFDTAQAQHSGATSDAAQAAAAAAAEKAADDQGPGGGGGQNAV